jgi:rRNA maturation RNase YbeY
MNSSIRSNDQTPYKDRLPEVAVQNAQRFDGLRAKTLVSWLQDLVAEVAPTADSFGVRFVTDAEMSYFNSHFSGKDGATDVLSFPGGLSAPDQHLGDVVIAVPWTRRQATSQGIPFEQEIKTLLLHGVLHCLGYDHESDDGEMNEIESRMRRKWIGNVD